MFSKLFGGKKDAAAGGDSGKPFAGDEGELWYIEGKAYDLAKFLKAHPGGADVLLEIKGKDGTAAFQEAHGGMSASGAPQKKLGRFEVKNVGPEILARKSAAKQSPAP